VNDLKKQAKKELEQLRSELQTKYTQILDMMKLENECLQTIVAK